jgi:hypothetical protein
MAFDRTRGRRTTILLDPAHGSPTIGRLLDPPDRRTSPSDLSTALDNHQLSGRAAYGPPPQAGSPGGPQNAVPSVQIHPVWEFPPAQAFQFYLNQTSTQQSSVPTQLPAVAGATLLLPGLIYKPPDFMKTVLRLVSIFCDAPNTTTNISYIVRLNQAPAAGFTFRFFPRLAANESVDFSVVLRDIPINTTVDMIIQNNAATGPWTVGGALSGWSYSEADAIRLYGSLAV